MSANPFKPTYAQALQAARQNARTGYVLSPLWRQPGKWPRGGKNVVFCGDAVAQVGRLKFGSDWTGGEVKARRRVYPFPDFRDTLAEFDHALTDFAERESRRSAGEDTQNPKCALGPVEKYEELYHTAKIKWDRFADENRKALNRLEWACGWLASKAQDGELITFLRLTDSAARGAIYERAPEGFWNVEDVLSCRFRSAGIGDAENQLYIFFDAESLESTSRDIRIFETPEEIGHLHLSAFMQLLLRAIEVHGITPENQPNHASLAKWFEGEWRWRHLDERLFKAMATFVRDVESMDGRARK
jgi:hypothetical protein